MAAARGRARDRQTENETEADSSGGAAGTGFLGREVLEVGALLLAGGAAHLLVIALGHSDGGGALLVGLGAGLVAVASAHRWRRHRRGHAPAEATGHRSERLWRLRVAVDDLPGGLAALTGRMAGLGADIRLVQVHPGALEALDDFYLTAPGDVTADRLRRAAVEAGGRAPVVDPADVRELADTTSRALSLATAVRRGHAGLPDALARLCGADSVVCCEDGTSEGRAPLGAREGSGGVIGHGELDGLAATELRVPLPGGRTALLRRDRVPFTAVELARARAFVEAAAEPAAVHGPW